MSENVIRLVTPTPVQHKEPRSSDRELKLLAIQAAAYLIMLVTLVVLSINLFRLEGKVINLEKNVTALKDKSINQKGENNE